MEDDAWDMYVIRMGRKELRKKCWLESLKGTKHSEDDVGLYRGIILKWILDKYSVGGWTELNWLQIEASGGL
jgi:hypothetical protein